MQVSLIAAVAENGVIGRDGKLPWHLPDDFRWFKAQTLGKPVVMGRKTWESLGRALPGRHNIVLTRQSGYAAPGTTVVHTAEAALGAAGDAEEVMVIGGGDVFEMFLPRAARVYLTRVDAVVEGDAWFPELDADDWRLVSRKYHGTDARHGYEFEFCVYERAGK
jgi:dihydrofolate reductase